MTNYQGHATENEPFTISAVDNDTATARRVSELPNRWPVVYARLRKAERVAARRDSEYRATPDGLAESQRRIDLCRDPGTMQRLLIEHRAGERAAAAEYRQRSARWPGLPGDGYLFALALPQSTDRLTRTLIALPLLGTIRISPDRSVPATVQLLHIDTAGLRHRTKFTAPRPHTTVTLGEVITHAHTVSAHAAKIRTLLSASYPLLAQQLHAEPLPPAHRQEGPSRPGRRRRQA